ncbi:MAG TPA: hypothetical protein VFB50_06920 [Chloroflexota bacterium]|nr:hypothetical protein [Chloroflexota bacterium]
MNGRVQVQDGLVEGLVEATNATGLKIGGAWLNRSQFHPVELPDAGARVRLKIDAKGFIKTLEVMDGTERVAKSPAVLSDKDERITRLAVLKAAAEFVGLWGQTREEIRSEHVLLIADKWLEWINK